MLKITILIISLLCCSLGNSQSYDYPSKGKGCSPIQHGICQDSRDLTKNGVITLDVEAKSETQLTVKTRIDNLNQEGEIYFLRDEKRNLEKNKTYYFEQDEDYQLMSEEIAAYRFQSDVVLKKGTYEVYFDEEYIYLKFNLI
jgi:hypothetical protein